MAFRHVLVALTLPLVMACSAGPNTQYLPIGERCTSNGQCGTQPYECADDVTHPGGYCELPCTSDASCPTDSECPMTIGLCRRKCGTDTECRNAEGYVCKPPTVADNEISPFCDYPTAAN